MKIKTLFFFIFFFSVITISYSQTIEFGGNFSTSNQTFYKNAFGVNVGYIQNFKKQYVFLQYSNVSKDNSYSSVGGGFVYGPNTYSMYQYNGKLNINTIRFGMAQKLLNNEKYCISLGVIGSLNYAKFDEKVKSFLFDATQVGTINIEEKVEKFKNRFAYGAFFDMELKQVLFNRLSLFSRIEVEDIELMGKNRPYGGRPQKTGYSSLSFMLGVRYNLKKSSE